MDKKFAIIYNLEGLSDQEIENYKRSAAVHFDLDPDTNPFDIVWMNDDGTGFKRRQIYARRGTTDILREKRGISIIEMTQHDGPGYVSFTAKGVNKDGRTEVAVGAHSTANLTGERLAAAISTAETRAGRRLTLKFVGMGILDHTEVTDPIDIKAPAPNLALLGGAAVIPPQPVFAPSAPPVLPAPAPVVAANESLAEADAVARMAYEKYQKTQAEIQAEAQKHLQDISAAPTATPPVVTEPKRPRKPRTRKNTVDIGTPAPAQSIGTDYYGTPVTPENTFTPEELARIEEAGKSIGYAVPPQVNSASPPQVYDVPGIGPGFPSGSEMAKQIGGVLVPSQAAHQPVLAPPQPAPVTDFPGKPSKEQEGLYRGQLREYSNNILPVEGGMTPSANIGGPSAKLRIFAERYTGKSTQLMTTTDWDEFFTFMAQFKDRNGAKGLVKYINDSIEAK